MKDSIERSVVREYWMQSVVCMPGYTPLGWWENDIYRVTKSGTWIEYEVKRSRSDFAADRSKSKWMGGADRNKHELLAADPSRGPGMFYFVTPKDLSIDVPEWAGLLIASEGRSGWSVSVKKQAPKRHGRTVEDESIRAIHRTAYFRFMHNWRPGVVEEVEAGAGI